MRRLALLVFIIILLPTVAPFDPMQTRPDSINQSPNPVHLFGTDMLGRDVLSRVMYGGRQTLFTAGLAALVAIIPGIGLGLTAGYFGGFWEKLVMALSNALLAFPGILLAFVVITLLGQGTAAAALAVGLSQIAAMIHVARSITLTVRSSAYVESAEAIGASSLHILRFYILPNCLPLLIAYSTIVFTYSILNSAGLSFLGLAGHPGQPEWGLMLAEGRSVFREAPWVSFFSGSAVTLTVFILTAIARYKSMSRIDLR